MTTAKETFSGRAAPELLATLRKIALAEGRDFETLLEDALQEYVANRSGTKVRPAVLAHYRASVERNRRLGELLAQ